MRSSVGQCRNIRFRQLYASHVIITSATANHIPPHKLESISIHPQEVGDILKTLKTRNAAGPDY